MMPQKRRYRGGQMVARYPRLEDVAVHGWSAFQAPSPSAGHVFLGQAGGELPEQRLLATLCAQAVGSIGRGAAFGPEEIDWTRFVALAKRHRVAPLVWHAISARPENVLPASVAAAFRAAYERNALNSLRLSSRLVRIISAFAEAGIVTVPLKGVSLAAKYYPVPAARHVGDIDLLVAPGRLADAGAILPQLGYRPTSKAAFRHTRPTDDTDYRLHNLYIDDDRVLVEVHFRLHNNADILPVGVDDIVAAGISVSLGKATLPVMSDTLQFVFLATHGARHEWERVQWVADIAVMVRAAAPDEVQHWLDTARGFGLVNPAVQALMIAHRLFGIALPPEAKRAFRRSWRIRFLVRRAERNLLSVADLPPTPPQSLKFGRRFYRLCVASRPRYLAAEVRDTLRAVAARLSGPAAPAG